MLIWPTIISKTANGSECEDIPIVTFAYEGVPEAMMMFETDANLL
jgi:hypothetical protein